MISVHMFKIMGFSNRMTQYEFTTDWRYDRLDLSHRWSELNLFALCGRLWRSGLRIDMSIIVML